jgi:hypothetical protein
MDQSLYKLLRACTLRVSVPGKAQGTGFFVAPGLVLTCAHVVVEAQKHNLEIILTCWREHNGSIEKQVISARVKEFRASPYPDLALLQIDLEDHPCVLLGADVLPFDQLYGYGCPDDYPDGDSVTLSCEGWTNEQQALLKLKQGQLRAGFSGAPLLNLRTGQVCGIAKLSRDQETDLGGRAVPTRTVLQELSFLEALQHAFHTSHTAWSPGTAGALELFYAYAPRDESLRQKLEDHLSLLRRQGRISQWYDRDIAAGDEAETEIMRHLNSAHIILLLISPSFMASDYCYHREMTRAMERHNAGNARVIPVILRPTDWQSAPFGGLVVVPWQGKPVVTWTNKDEAFLDVAKSIRGVVDQLTKSSH